MKRRSLGWIRDSLDRRDDIFSSPRLKQDIKLLPAAFNLRSSFPLCYDQSTLGSCTANAVAGICDFKYGVENAFFPARLFLYYMTRLIEGTTLIDNGATIRNTIKAVNKYGICEEYRWSYRVAYFNVAPSPEARVDASKHQALNYRRVRQRLDDLRAAIADSLPVAFGFLVYESFYDLNSLDHTVKIPGANETPEGGHAVVAVGYDDALQCFIIRNSWGPDWGDNGYFLMPYSLLLDRSFCSDFWTIELME